MTPVEDRGVRLAGRLPDVAFEARLERALSKIVAIDSTDVFFGDFGSGLKLDKVLLLQRDFFFLQAHGILIFEEVTLSSLKLVLEAKEPDLNRLKGETLQAK